MPKYSGKVTVTVTRTYEIVLETEVGPGNASVAGEPKVAFDQIRYFALGMKQADLDALEADPMHAGSYQGEETTVVDVWDVREEPEDEEEVILERERMMEREDQAWGEWAAHDPEAAERAATDLVAPEPVKDDEDA